MKDKLILLVEDNPMDEELTTRALRKAGITNEIFVARDGSEAVEILLGTEAAPGTALPRLPAVVLLDLKLPKLNGIDVLRRIRGNPLTRLVPVVLLTSSNEENDILRGYEFGANSYVRKQVEFSAFNNAVGQLGTYWLSVNECPPTFE